MALRLALATLALSAVILYGALFGSRPAQADHIVYLPLVPNTPLMRQIIATQEYTWCVGSRASAYPGFVSQLRDVTDHYTRLTGIRSRQVGFDDASCQVKHTMPDSFSCGAGAAACIYYANWPVTIEYKYTLGFVDWRSAMGHELGHGLLGLHEMYKNSGGGIQCTQRTDTVMDCGSGVRYPQPLDVQRGCAIILSAWCGTDGMAVCTTDGWNPCTQRWHFSDGWSYDPATGVWWNPSGTPEWTPCNADRLRFNLYYRTKGIELWFVPGSSMYDVQRGYWVSAGAC